LQSEKWVRHSQHEQLIIISLAAAVVFLWQPPPLLRQLLSLPPATAVWRFFPVLLRQGLAALGSCCVKACCLRKAMTDCLCCEWRPSLSHIWSY
jgi:hypothetical protein